MRKPGHVETVSVNLDLITDPIPIPMRRSRQVAGARLIPCGRGMGGAGTLGYKVRRWGGVKGGNQKTAGWRKPHGGAFVSPLNSRLKPVR